MLISISFVCRLPFHLGAFVCFEVMKYIQANLVIKMAKMNFDCFCIRLTYHIIRE